MATQFYIVTIIISILVHGSFQDESTVPAIGTDCLGNDFLCVDQTQFLICVERDNGFQTADQQTQTCGSKSYCDNSLNYECASAVPVTDAPSSISDESTLSTLDATTTADTTLVDSTSQNEASSNAENVDQTTQSQEIGTESTVLGGETIAIVEELSTTVAENPTTVVSETSTNAPEEESTASTGEVTGENIFSTTGTSEIVNETTPTVESTMESTTTARPPVSTTVTGGATDEIAISTTGGTGETSGVATTSSNTAEVTTTTLAPTTTASPICPSSGLHPHPTECTMFVLCININRNYRVIDMKCPFNRAYDPATKRCSTDKARFCEKSNLSCTSSGYFKDPNSSVRYYMCVSLGNGNFWKLDLSCSAQFVFNEKRKRCVYYNRNDSGENQSTESRNSNEDRSNSKENQSKESRW